MFTSPCRVIFWVWTIFLLPGMADGGLPQAPRRICPVDEAAGNESLVGFRDKLRAAVRARDVEALRPLVDPEIVVGGLSQQYRVGFEAFVESFGFRDPRSSYWVDVERLLSQGGVMEPQGTFCAPYFMCPAPPMWEEGTVVVLGYDVPAYARPDLVSDVVARLSCDVLRLARGDDLTGLGPLIGWTGVHLPTKGLAFVEDFRVDGAPGLYLRIGRKNGDWKLIQLEGTD